MIKIIEELSNIMSNHDSCSRLCHDKAAEEIYNKYIKTKESAMCEANSNAVLGEVGELLPCPFCGGESYLSKISKYSCEYTIVCKCCAADGGWSKTAGGAVWNWNRRANLA